MSYERPDPKTIQRFFDAISKRYDFLNSFLSFSLDGFWRRQAIRMGIDGSENSVLDVGTGTGKSLVELMRAKKFPVAVGCDFSQGMLCVAKEKINGALLARCDLHALPFRSESFDLVASSFVLRSVHDMDLFLSETERVMTKNGKFVFLDLTRPKNKIFWRLFFWPYLNLFLPFLGGIISAQSAAYRFLSDSINAFVDPENLRVTMERLGFESIQVRQLTFGAVTVFTGRKKG